MLSPSLMRRSRFVGALFFAFAVAAAGVSACSSSSTTASATLPVVEAGPGTTNPSNPDPEGGSSPDAADAADAKPHDAGVDTGGSDDILGTLASGSCGIVKNELTQATPSLENNLLVFVAGETYDRASLSPGGQALFDIANAGGSSVESEVMSFEVLHFCEGATLLKSETQISYEPPSDAGANTITDILGCSATAEVQVTVGP